VEALDLDRLRQALELAELSVGLSEPNPRVGCVIGDREGHVFGSGFTQAAGGAHAEVMALRDAARSGASLRGSVAWVSLEPCAHHGRTPPCAEALLQHGVSRVVAAVSDPFPSVSGRGFEQLRRAGVEVTLASESPGGEEVARLAREMNIGFFSRFERGRPWVRLKVAASLDGKTALEDGRSQWITGPSARADGHGWRRRAGAILTGIGTVLADDPQLNVREVSTNVQPRRAVVDTHARTPATARILAGPEGAIVYVGATAETRLIRSAGAEVCVVDVVDGHLALDRVVADLARRQVNELHVEAGATLSGALLRAGLVDELLVYLAPIVVGQGKGMFGLEPPAELALARAFHFTQIQAVGSDLRVLARPTSRAGA